jgi:hypothetical protein
MFTKDKLEKWIYWLEDCIKNTNLALKTIKKTSPIYAHQEEKRNSLIDLKNELSGIYELMTRDGSI